MCARWSSASSPSATRSRCSWKSRRWRSCRPCRVDLGKLAVAWIRAGRTGGRRRVRARTLDGLETFPSQVIEQPQDVVLYGFGRIGRLLARLLIERTGSAATRFDCAPSSCAQARTTTCTSAPACCAATRSTAGSPAPSQIDEENNALIANGHFIKVIYANAPDERRLHSVHGIDQRDRHRQHRQVARPRGPRPAPGRPRAWRKALLTAPGKGDIKNIVFGVNDDSRSRTTTRSSPPRAARPTRSRPCCARCSTDSASSAVTSRPSTPTRTIRT